MVTFSGGGGAIADTTRNRERRHARGRAFDPQFEMRTAVRISLREPRRGGGRFKGWGAVSILPESARAAS